MNTPEEDIFDKLVAIQPKLCINCKHLGRNGSGDALRYRCFAKQNFAGEHVDVVTGIKIVAQHFATCYDARAAGVQRHENCGPEGRWFEEAPPKFEYPTGLPKAVSVNSASDLLSQLNSMK